MTIRAAVLLVASALSACAPVPLRTTTVLPMFGPVVSPATISGRADDELGMVWLMVGGKTMVRIDLNARQGSEIRLQVGTAEPCWGLARLTDGSFWTLNERNALIQIGSDGKLVREVGLPNAHLAVFSGGDRLVLQRASLPAGAPAMIAGPPGDPEPQPWSAMTVRAFERLAIGAAAALNLVSCGTSERTEMPCWFPDEPVISLIARDGTTRRVPLEGLAHVSPDALIDSAAPPRPIRDVFVERDGTLWVLSTGTAAAGKDVAGGWLLLRYGSRGQLIDRRVLPEPVRLILRARSGKAVVLTGAGMVAEVQP